MTWNDSSPALGNQISADVPDILENFKHLALWAKERRSVFTYNGGATAYTVKCKSAFYYCKDKVCWWDAELTTGAIGAPAANDWFYLYLDHSAITSGTEITNSELLWDSTEPSWNTSYAGWYNGNDRCIFAALCNGTPDNILEFFHDGDFVIFADEITDRASVDLDTTWTDVTLTIPVFARKAQCLIRTNFNTATAVSYWRTNGQTGTSGHTCGYAAAGVTNSYNTTNVLTDSSQKIEVKLSISNGETLAVYTNGWYFPIGL